MKLVEQRPKLPTVFYLILIREAILLIAVALCFYALIRDQFRLLKPVSLICFGLIRSGSSAAPFAPVVAQLALSPHH